MQALLMVLVAALIALVLVMVLGGGDDVELTPGEPQTVSLSELETFAEDAERPVYWVGEKPDTEYELTETEEGGVFIRYLTGSADPEAEQLTVGSYLVPDAAAALQRTARADDKELARSDDGAVVLINPEAAGGVHLAYPGADTQIEIFSPVPGQALRFAARDRAQPITETVRK